MVEALEIFLTHAASLLKALLEVVALGAVAIGLLDALRLAATGALGGMAGAFDNFRLRFGRWLVIALEFQLGADIVGTTVSPSFDALAQLAIVAVIRTALNYFLNRELAELGRRDARPVAATPPEA